MSKFNEATRVQMPALVHLTRLGYTYFGKISEEYAEKVYYHLVDASKLDEEYKKVNKLTELFAESHRLESEILQQLDTLKFNS